MTVLIGIFIALGIICVIAGIIFSVLPPLPGPPIAFCALLFLQLAGGKFAFHWNFLLIIAGLNVGVVLLDYIMPIFGAKVSGASRWGIIGSIIGMIVGIPFFPPLGMIVGVFVGAFIGELLKGKKGSEALKAGFGTFFFSVLTIAVKILMCGLSGFIFTQKVIQALFTG